MNTDSAGFRRRLEDIRPSVKAQCTGMAFHQMHVTFLESYSNIAVVEQYHKVSSNRKFVLLLVSLHRGRRNSRSMNDTMTAMQTTS